VSGRLIGRLVVLVAALALATASPAAAQSPTQDAYGGALPGVTEEVSAPPEIQAVSPAATQPVQQGADTGGLPFSGLQVGAMIIAGIVMLGAGAAVRRTTGPTA
jgi:hypothetical protein